MSQDILKEKWDGSYSRGENFIFGPKDESIKFLNRFVRKRTGVDTFRDILSFNETVRGLDYGCGVGGQTILMKSYGIDAYGVDISSVAIETARNFSVCSGYPDLVDRFQLVAGGDIPFTDSFFDITISEAVLDSMKFDIAKRVLSEIDRVTKSLVFISLISGDSLGHGKEFSGDEVVATEFEQGTIQSYYNWSKIQELIAGTRFSIKWCHLLREEGVVSPYRVGRYFLVLSKELIK